MTSTSVTDSAEQLEEFRARARAWLADNMPRSGANGGALNEEGLADGRSSEEVWQRNRELQSRLHSGGYAGLCFPKEYGGQGLPAEYQHVFNEEVGGYELPTRIQTPHFSICGATILDMASEEIKKEHLPKAITGEEIFVQFLSEPRGGSDLAGVTTRATRDGDVFVLNGSKIWSSGAFAGDYALCLARTDWDAPKHRGLTMFLVKIHQPGITIRRIKQVNGNEEFCQEFFDDVELPLSAVVGEVNGGRAVASRQTTHERAAIGGGSPYMTYARNSSRVPERDRAGSASAIIDLARRTGQSADPRIRELIAESHTIDRITQQLTDRVMAGIHTDALPVTAGAILRMYSGEASTRRAEIALEIAGTHAIHDGRGDLDMGTQFLFRQASSIGGGTTEISKNIVSERVLSMPREFAADRDIPFNQVRQGKPGNST